jgi:hypothetical protein
MISKYVSNWLTDGEVLVNANGGFPSRCGASDVISAAVFTIFFVTFFKSVTVLINGINPIQTTVTVQLKRRKGWIP